MAPLYDGELTDGSVDRAVASLAERQYGVFSRGQAVAVGASRHVIDHRLRAGRWTRVSRDVFRLAGNPASWRQSLVAAVLAWGLDSVLSHRAAAALWRLAGFETERVEVTTPPDRRRRRGPGIVHRCRLDRVDVTAIHGIPVTTPARTLLDIAAVVPRDAVEEALDDALRRGLVSITRLRWRLDALGRRPGATIVRALLDVREGITVPQSVFETRLARVMERAGLPRFRRQHQVRDAGRVVAVVDLALPEAKLAIEADGYRWHSGRARWEHDLARRNELMLLGWRIIHVTWTDLTRRPGTVIDAIKEAMTAS